MEGGDWPPNPYPSLPLQCRNREALPLTLALASIPVFSATYTFSVLWSYPVLLC